MYPRSTSDRLLSSRSHRNQTLDFPGHEYRGGNGSIGRIVSDVADLIIVAVVQDTLQYVKWANSACGYC
jgi:hypothetical protein